MRKWLNHLVLEVNAFKHLRLDIIKFYLDKLNHLTSMGIVL